MGIVIGLYVAHKIIRTNRSWAVGDAMPKKLNHVHAVNVSCKTDSN